MGVPPRIIFFSGLGTGAELLEPQMNLPARVEVAPWIDPLPNESLAGYTQRVLQRLDLTPPIYFAGVSMGGMMAIEAAKHAPAKGVFVIAAAASYHPLPWHLRFVGRLLPTLPLWVLKLALWLSPLGLRYIGRFDRRQRALILRVLKNINYRAYRWGANAMMSWTAPSIDSPIYHIHGNEDWTFLSERVRPDRTVPGGGHLLNITHARAVNNFITEHLRD
jgi:pimeloyl-ACP methyl ester carboxylesterase